MFHHFHGKKHQRSVGSIDKNQLLLIIKYLKSKYKLLPAKLFLSKASKGKLSPKEICLTFDDNLRSQYDIAFPILKKKRITAFFFIYSSIFDKNLNLMEIFRDFSNSKFKNINDFYLLFFNMFKELNKNKFKNFKKKFNSNYLKEYKFYSIQDRKYRFVRDLILTKKEYNKIMMRMIKIKKYNIKKNYLKLFMSKKHLSDLIKDGNLIGLHSHNHRVNLKKISRKDQLIDYKKNKNFIKKNFGIESQSASYPFGRYNSQTLSIMKDLGIKIAFLSRMNNSRSNLKLGRIDHVNLLKKIR